MANGVVWQGRCREPEGAPSGALRCNHLCAGPRAPLTSCTEYYDGPRDYETFGHYFKNLILAGSLKMEGHNSLRAALLNECIEML